MIFNLIGKPLVFILSNFQYSFYVIGFHYLLLKDDQFFLEIQEKSQNAIDPLSFVVGTMTISSFVILFELIYSLMFDGKTRYDDMLSLIKRITQHFKTYGWKAFRNELPGESRENDIQGWFHVMERRLKPHGNGYSESHK